MFSKLDELLSLIAVILVVSVPLAIWKLIDIFIWIYNHVQVSVK